MSREYRTYRAEGIVLRRRNLGEADSIFTVFGPRIGKFEAIARGVRKSRSKMRGHMEPLTFSRFLLAQGRSLDVFTQAETVRTFPRLRDDLASLQAALHCAEVCERVTSDHHENDELFGLLLACLEAFDAGAPSRTVRMYFDWHALRLSGFELQVARCVSCGQSLPEEESLFSASAGGAVCRNCRHLAGAGSLLSVRAIKLLRYAARSSLSEILRIHVPADVDREVSHGLADAVQYYLEQELRTEAVSRQLARSLGEDDTQVLPPV